MQITDPRRAPRPDSEERLGAARAGVEGKDGVVRVILAEA